VRYRTAVVVPGCLHEVILVSSPVPVPARVAGTAGTGALV
jgi:hypothetical protein